MANDTKQCLSCGNHKHTRMFYTSSTTEDGYNRYCKHCCKVNRALESVRKRDKKSKISIRQRHRAQNLGIECHTDILLVEVFRRQFGLCALCDEWVQPRHASIDHITPISHGGTHTWDNVQLVHLVCNLRKGNRYSG